MNEKLNNALYERMSAEQKAYREWLLARSPEEILNHAYEYTIREDIVLVMEHFDLSDEQAAVLLSLPSPLSDLFADFVKLETDHIVVLECLKRRAETLLKVQRELPVYQYTVDYAQEHGELKIYHASFRANIACKEAIEAAITKHYKDYQLEADEAVEQVVEQFGYDRMFYVLANTVRMHDNDIRISWQNREWAGTIPICENRRYNNDYNSLFVVDHCNLGLTNIFLSAARESWDELQSKRSKE